jgi:26S proteasome regulatory subunit T3
MEIDTVSKPIKHSTQPETKDEEDLYMRMRELERELELLSMQEEFLKDEQRHLKSEYIRSKEEVRNPKFG